MSAPMLRHYPLLRYTLVQEQGEFRVPTAADMRTLPTGRDLTDEEIEIAMGLKNSPE